MSSRDPAAVVDTVVLRYFLFVDRIDLLVAGLGEPLGVPRVVYDPTEDQAGPDARCEISRSVGYQQKRAVDARLSEGDRAQARRNVARLSGITRFHEAGTLVVVDMNDEERELYGRLTSPAHVGEYGLLFPLDPGEAACVALAVCRRLTLATDDSDALTALKHLAADHPYQRIRKLLRELGETGTVTKETANDLHAEMTALNFWDREAPFPD